MSRKQRSILLGIIALIILFRWFNSSPERDEASIVIHARSPLPPTATAAEWLERWEKDLATSDGTARHLYAELPPLAEWDALTSGLEQRLALDDKEFTKRFSLSPFQRPASIRLSYRFFIACLRDDAAAIEATFREIITQTHPGQFGSNRMPETLALSRDPDEALSWIREHRPQWLEVQASRYGTPTRERWRELLASGRNAEAVELLWQDGSTSAVARILEIARLTDDLALKERALDHLRGRAEGDSNTEFYDKRPWLNHLASQGKWKEIARLLPAPTAGRPHLEMEAWFRLACIRHLQGTQAYLKAFDAYLSEHSMGRNAVLAFFDQSQSEEIDPATLHLEALTASGRTDEARALALYLLAVNRREDDAYRRLQAIDPVLFASFLDRLHAYDPYEERPFIWKAKIALEKGDIPAAKRLIDAAIALDPADGDQYSGGRMHAYEVLAEVHQALGEEDQATFFREVVAAIREGEIADEWRAVGMTGEAARRYRAALGRFNDAYCLQSRLALMLAGDGRFDEAIPHFRRAFELMPVSFGPRESHCFGCEGLFSEDRVRTLAREVLSDFSAKHPENPRAPYLLGLVLQSMKLNNEAADAFQAALKLDPGYYHAAKQLVETLDELPARFSERANVLQILRKITPYPILGDLFADRTDLRNAWIEASALPASPLDLPPFPISLPAANPDAKHTSYYDYRFAGYDAIDGWSVDEICRHNWLLQTLD